jgi:hypothetical protein
MKSKIFLVIFFLTSIVSIGQETYKSFINPGVTKWLYFTPADACGMHENATYGDTIINQLTYKQIWRSGNYYLFPPNTNIDQHWRDNNKLSDKINAYIRQSDDSSKLYFYNGENNTEYLITDMNLKVGDEFSYPGLESDTVESVIYENGLKTILFKGYHNKIVFGKLIFVEGIGPNRDFMYIFYSNRIGEHILICYSNSIFFYHLPDFGCGCIIDKIDSANSNKTKVVKQADKIEISFDSEEQKSCEIFDTYGKRVFHSNNINQKVLQIPTSNLSTGIYFIKIINSGDNSFTSMKIIL